MLLIPQFPDYIAAVYLYYLVAFGLCSLDSGPASFRIISDEDEGKIHCGRSGFIISAIMGRCLICKTPLLMLPLNNKSQSTLIYSVLIGDGIYRFRIRKGRQVGYLLHEGAE